MLATDAANEANQYYGKYNTNGAIEFKTEKPRKGEPKTLRRSNSFAVFNERLERNFQAIADLQCTMAEIESEYGDWPEDNLEVYFEKLWKVNSTANPFIKANTSVRNGCRVNGQNNYRKDATKETKNAWPASRQLVLRSSVESAEFLFKVDLRIASIVTGRDYNHLVEQFKAGRDI